MCANARMYIKKKTQRHVHDVEVNCISEEGKFLVGIRKRVKKEATGRGMSHSETHYFVP